ncbi:MAG: hypothetical protein IJS21_04435, partial [Deltaproteobacteria bacterium]|nr:hypothetical protein [Deltaproteobacteria bacterium]
MIVRHRQQKRKLLCEDGRDEVFAFLGGNAKKVQLPLPQNGSCQGRIPFPAADDVLFPCRSLSLFK